MSTEAHRHDAVLTPATLRLLTLVDSLGGIGAASRTVGMTQPQASRILSALERHLGYPLLLRSPRGTTFTAEGLAVLAQARLVLAEQERLERVVDALAAPTEPARLELAASRTIGEHLVPTWLGLQAAAHPSTWVSFRLDHSANVEALVRDGVVPLGFVEDPALPDAGGPVRHAGAASAAGTADAEVAWEVLAWDRLCVIVPRGHAWEGGSVTPDRLAATALVEREPGSGTRATLDAALPRRAAPAAVLDSNAAIARAVAAGLAPAVLSEMAVEPLVASGAVARVPLEGVTLDRPLRAMWRAGVPVTAQVRDFLDLVRAATGRGEPGAEATTGVGQQESL